MRICSFKYNNKYICFRVAHQTSLVFCNVIYLNTYINRVHTAGNYVKKKEMRCMTGAHTAGLFVAYGLGNNHVALLYFRLLYVLISTDIVQFY